MNKPCTCQHCVEQSKRDRKLLLATLYGLAFAFPVWAIVFIACGLQR